MAECDRHGNVNVSRFGPKLAGAGGFINISQNAEFVCFMGTFMSRATLTVEDGALKVEKEGSGRKFVSEVEQITFSGDFARKRGQTVYYVTERAVFSLVDSGLKLLEIAPGLDLERDILSHMDFRPEIAEPLSLMRRPLFLDDLMGLEQGSHQLVSDRLHYDPESNTVFVHFEGLRMDTVADVEELSKTLDEYFQSLGQKVKAVVNYDNFFVAPAAESAYFEMVQRNSDQYFTSSVRYATDAFFRRKSGTKFARAKTEIYDSYSEALQKLKASGERESALPSEHTLKEQPPEVGGEER